MALHPFWNPLRSYTTYKKHRVEISYVDEEYIEDATTTAKVDKKSKMSSFLAKLKGTFFMFSGYLDDPSRFSGYMDMEDDTPDFKPGQNHLGIFDYLTLGIPYAIESLFRGNFFESKMAQKICQAIFSIIPIVPALATVRNGIGLIATIISSPVVLGIHIGDMVWHAYQKNKRAKKRAESAEMENDPNLKQFHDNYKALSGLFKRYKSAESMLALASDGGAMQQRKDDAMEYCKNAYDAAARVVPMEIKSPAFFDRKKDKILAGGKYSIANIEKKFGFRI